MSQHLADPESLQLDGDAPRSIIVAGHSHMLALVGDACSAEAELHSVPQHPNVFALHGPLPRLDSYWQTLKQKSAGHRIALVWGGNEHNLFYFFEDQPFDLVSQHVKKIISTFDIIPQRKVKETYYEYSIKALQPLLVDLAADRTTQISVVGTPPPKKDNDKLREILVSEPHFEQIAASLGRTLESVRIRAPHVRLKLWFLLQDMLGEAVRKAGGKFIPVPAQAQDEDGFLRPEYWHSDVTHANHSYGEIMLKHIVAEFSEA